MVSPKSEIQGQRRALTFSLCGDFRGRTPLTRLIRQAVSGLLLDAGCDREAQSAGMLVAQELAENLVKYSRTSHTSFVATAQRLESEYVELSLETANDASAEEITRVQSLLAEVELRADPHSLYQERVASSSTRSRSELGLLRIVAESAMALSLRVEGERIHFFAKSGLLNVGLVTSAGPKPVPVQRKGESIR